MKTEKQLIQKFKTAWRSPIVPKKEISSFTGGLLKPQTLTNLTAMVQGPPNVFNVRGRACYEIDELLDWLLDRMTNKYIGFEIHKETPNYKKKG